MQRPMHVFCASAAAFVGTTPRGRWRFPPIFSGARAQVTQSLTNYSQRGWGDPAPGGGERAVLARSPERVAGTSFAKSNPH
jgi:hypothetical protein